MSFYRTFIAAVAALGLATSVMAADEATTAPAASDAQASVQTTDASQIKINLNKATAKELAKVDGLSKSKANAIVAYRKKHGDFKTLDDLKEVKGFKKMDDDNMKQLQDKLSID